MDLLESLFGKKKGLQWHEVSREKSKNLAKAVKVYWNTLGYKVRIKKRKDDKYSVFVLDTVTKAEEYGLKPKRFKLF